MTDRTLRLKRLRMRAWHRGTKEMDLVLGGFVDRHAEALSEADLDALETLMEEPDQDLYRWVSGAEPAPPHHRPLIARIASDFGLDPGR